MIPIAPISIGFLVLFVLVPIIGLVLSVVIITVLLLAIVKQLKTDQPAVKSLLLGRKFIILSVFVVLCDAWFGYMLYLEYQIRSEIEERDYYRSLRKNFILTQDFQYGDLVLPAGSLVNRYDPHDTGKPERKLEMRGLNSVRFPQPILVAGVWANALEAFPGRIELAKDQNIGPVFDYVHGKGWIKDTIVSSVSCTKGQVAVFEVPLIDYDIQAEFVKGKPDGPAARFKPDQWQFLRCENTGPIDVPPPAPHKTVH